MNLSNFVLLFVVLLLFSPLLVLISSAPVIEWTLRLNGRNEQANDRAYIGRLVRMGRSNIVSFNVMMITWAALPRSIPKDPYIFILYPIVGYGIYLIWEGILEQRR